MILPTMVICDDEVDLVDELAEWFSLKGWTVRTTLNAQTALDLLTGDGHTTCLVLDRQLPKTDSSEILRRIATLPAAKRPDVVALITGDADVEGMALPDGVDLVFIKPVDLAEMSAAIAAQLAAAAPWRLRPPEIHRQPVHAL